MTDDTTALLSALTSGQLLDFSNLVIRVTQPISLSQNDTTQIDIDGGDILGSSLLFDSSGTHLQFNEIETHIKNIGVHCTGHQTGMNAGIHLRRCNNSSIERVLVDDPDSVGILLYECDFNRVADCRIDFDESRYDAHGSGGVSVGTAIQLLGCSMTTVERCRSRYSNFTFSILGKEYTDNAQSGSAELVTRSVDETYGNVMRDCHAHHYRGTAFNINGIHGASYDNCLALDQHEDSGYCAYQIKHPLNGSETSFNTMTNCVAVGAYSGFYSQGGSKNAWRGCRTVRTQRFGYRLNLANNHVIDGCIADEFALKNETNVNGGFVVRQSNGNILTNNLGRAAATCPSSACLISVELDSADNTLGAFSSEGSCPTGLLIASTAVRTRITPECLVGMEAGVTNVLDGSSTSEYL